MQRIKVGAAHYAPVFMDTGATIEKVCAIIDQAGRDGLRLVVFPEVFVPGFPYWINCYPPLLQAPLNRRYQDASIEVPGAEIAAVQAAARRAGTAVVLGVSERAVGGRTCFNTCVVVDTDGRLAGAHRKLQPTYAERYIWGQGDGSTLNVYPTAAGRIGTLACWEHTMNLARQALVLQGAQVHAALWPGLSTLAGFGEVVDSQIEAMMKNHALTGQCFVVAAANPVTPAMLEYMERELGAQSLMGPGGGWSAIVHPFTAYLAGPHTGTAERLLSAEIDLDELADVKMWLDGAGHYARPEILRLLLDAEPKQPLLLRGAGQPPDLAPAAGDRPAPEHD